MSTHRRHIKFYVSVTALNGGNSSSNCVKPPLFTIKQIQTAWCDSPFEVELLAGALWPNQFSRRLQPIVPGPFDRIFWKVTHFDTNRTNKYAGFAIIQMVISRAFIHLTRVSNSFCIELNSWVKSCFYWM